MLLSYIYYLFYCNFLYKNNFKHNKILYNCGKTLNQVTFRLPKNYDTNWLSSFLIFKHIFSNLFKKHNFEFRTDTYEAFYDASFESDEIRLNYLRNFNSEKNYSKIYKNELLIPHNKINLLQIFIVSFVIFPFIFILSCFKKDKKQLSFLYQQAIECFNINVYLTTNRIKKLHFFSIFQTDANICAYLLMKKGIYINKIPSEVPLFVYNSSIVSNCLSFCFGYQKEEFNYFKDTMFVDETQMWSPELIFNAPMRFLKETKEAHLFNYDIGFYSSGNWLRKELGDAELETNDAHNEQLILTELIKLCNENNYKLRIYCHPIEKRNQELTINYYQKFNSKNFSIAPFDKPSIEEFDKVNIAISLISTLMFERYYLGFKTIIAPINYLNFPISNSNFNNVCVKEVNQLEKIIKKNIKLTINEFFELNGINNYRNV
jgi:hypothetical protein